MRAAVRWGLFSFGVIVAASRGAAGAPDPGAIEAQTRFEEGLARVRAGDFAAACVSFEQAYAVLRRPGILWNLALAEEKTGRLLDALAHFKQVARDPATLDADRTNAQLHADRLASEIGHIDVLAPPGVLLTVDGGPISAVSPLSEPLDVPVGHHVIEAKLAQGPKVLAVDAAAGQIVHLSFLGGEAGASMVPAPGATTPSAVSAPPPAPSDASDSALHTSLRSDASQGKTVTAPRVATTAIVGGAAVAAVVLGIYFGEQSRTDADRAADFRRTYGRAGCTDPVGPSVATCHQWNDAVKSQNLEATASNALYVAGAVLAAGAIATWLLWPANGETGATAFWVAPSMAPGVTEVAAGGRFP